jgi:hypothetical protein
MTGATIEEITTSGISETKEQRLERFIQIRKAISKQKTGPAQTLLAKIHKIRSKKAGLSSDLLCELLRDFGAEVSIEHTLAPKLDIPVGASCFGEREVMENIWFGEDDQEPHFGNLPDDIDKIYISAQQASGYSVAKVSLPISHSEQQIEISGTINEMEKELSKHFIIVYGKSICSANETFNGNIGAWFALMDALHLISAKDNLGLFTPLRKLFSFAVSLLDVDFELPSHYTDYLDLMSLE